MSPGSRYPPSGSDSGELRAESNECPDFAGPRSVYFDPRR